MTNSVKGYETSAARHSGRGSVTLDALATLHRVARMAGTAPIKRPNNRPKTGLPNPPGGSFTSQRKDAMDRRGFLGSLMAVTTAIASGVKLPTGKELAAAPRAAVGVQNDLLALLNDCVPLSIEANHSVSGPMTYTIEYLHSPGNKVNETTAMIESYTKQMRPVSVRFLQKAGDLTKLTVEWM